MREESSQLGSTLEFMRLLWSLAHGMQSRSKRMETSLGVTGPQRLVLRILGRTPGTTAGALARAMFVHPSTLTGVLRRLEERGLLERKKDSIDGRKALLTLTAAGRKLDSQQAGTVEAAVRRTLARLNEDEVEIFRKVLAALVDELARTDR
ncbi:MAG: MarR family transcriptional regulator [Polyangiaceae bacterium]